MARIAPLRLPFLLVLVAILLAVHTPTVTRAQTTTMVCPSGCQYSKIEDAVIATSAGGAAATGTTVTVAPGTYQEDQGLIIGSSMTIQGVGQPFPIVSAKPGSRLRAVSALGPNTVSGGAPVVVTLENLTIQGSNLVGVSEGASVDSAELGGGLSTGAALANGGTLTLTSVTVSGGNTDIPGGGIFNGGTLTLNNSTVSGNTSSGGLGGGGIFNSGTLTLNNSKVVDNTTSGARGGGILNTTFNLFGGAANAMLTLNNSMISNNSVAAASTTCATSAGGGDNGVSNNGTGDPAVDGTCISGSGGGIANDGTATISASTITGNTATAGGGGLDTASGTATLTNSTVSGNSSRGGGGGIFTTGPVVLIGSTITGNTGGGGGGGIFFSTFANAVGTVTLTNSSVTGNTPNNCQPATNSAGIQQCLGSAAPTTPTTPTSPATSPGAPAPATGPQGAASPASTFTGSWTVDDFGYGAGGTLRLVQNGNQVTGTYVYADPSGCGIESGTLTGTVNGNTLTSSTVETGCGGEASGSVTVTLAPDGRSFTGDWDGTRTGP